MRQERTIQANIFDLFAGHEIGRELKAMSAPGPVKKFAPVGRGLMSEVDHYPAIAGSNFTRSRPPYWLLLR